MRNAHPLTARRALIVFFLALAGAVGGILVGPPLVRAFHGAPSWLLPAVICGAVGLALIAAFMAFRLANRPLDRAGRR